jgi:hypothetical protein
MMVCIGTVMLQKYTVHDFKAFLAITQCPSSTAFSREIVEKIEREEAFQCSKSVVVIVDCRLLVS